MQSCTTDVRFSVQGPLHVAMDGVDVELGPVRQQAVFVMLLFNAGRVVTPTAILRGVWGDEAPSSGRKVIPPYVYRLRRILQHAATSDDRPVIETLRLGYRLNLRSASTDIDEFEKTLERAAVAQAAGEIRQAAALLAAGAATWYGEPLAGLPGPFAEAKRLYLAERRLVCLERHLALEVQLRRYDTAIPALMAMLAEHPLRERVASTLMVALHRAGRQHEALDVFGRVRRSLASQLGLGPTGELTATYEALLRAGQS